MFNTVDTNQPSFSPQDHFQELAGQASRPRHEHGRDARSNSRDGCSTYGSLLDGVEQAIFSKAGFDFSQEGF